MFEGVAASEKQAMHIAAKQALQALLSKDDEDTAGVIHTHTQAWKKKNKGRLAAEVMQNSVSSINNVSHSKKITPAIWFALPAAEAAGVGK